MECVLSVVNGLLDELESRRSLKCRLASGRRLGMAINGGNGQR